MTNTPFSDSESSLNPTRKSESCDVGPWHVLNRRTLLDAKPWLSIIQEEVRLPSGRVIHDFYRINLRDFVVIVPIDPNGRLVFVRGYKHGPQRETLSPPAGLIEASELPLAAATRELLEETGYESDDWQALGSYVVDANRHCGTMHLFLARNAKYVQEPANDETEVLKVELRSRADAIAALAQGEISGLAAAAAMGIAFTLLDASQPAASV